MDKSTWSRHITATKGGYNFPYFPKSRHQDMTSDGRTMSWHRMWTTCSEVAMEVLKVKVRIELRHSQNPLCTGERELEVAVMGTVHDVSVKTGLVILTESITLVPCWALTPPIWEFCFLNLQSAKRLTLIMTDVHWVHTIVFFGGFSLLPWSGRQRAIIFTTISC